MTDWGTMEDTSRGYIPNEVKELIDVELGVTTTPWPSGSDELTVTQRVAEALAEDLVDQGRSRADAAYVVRQRWKSFDVDEPEEFWAWLEEERP